MRVQRITIENYRNFANLDVFIDTHAVIVGENRTGKSNLLQALRLVLDPSLPDSARQLQESDFWDGLSRPLSKDDVITISVDLTDFESNEDLLAVLAEHLIQPEPMVARLTYRFQPLPHVEVPVSEADYEFLIFGGNREENRVGHELRRHLPLDILPALRDAEGDLAAWRRSPLRPLLDRVSSLIPRHILQEIAESVTNATLAVKDNSQIAGLEQEIVQRVHEMVGREHAIAPSLGFSPADPDRLIRAIRLYIDEGRRGISEASLGTANILFIALKELELQQMVEQGTRDHTFLGIEEPEAHLHPHLQRLVYRDMLHGAGTRSAHNGVATAAPSLLLTTHSPHITSVAPLRSLVLLRRTGSPPTTRATSTAQVELAEEDIADLERYLDVTRGELLFAKGILFVEGDAELFILPALARSIGIDFDELGITVCSISGTNFLPYIKLVSHKALNIPFAVVTDLDPREDGRNPYGHTRVATLVKSLMKEPVHPRTPIETLVARAPEYGVFLNRSTLETELFASGLHGSMCRTLVELSQNRELHKRAEAWQVTPSTINNVQLIKDIESIGKGRFAQRLASNLHEPACPSYIREAIVHVVEHC